MEKCALPFLSFLTLFLLTFASSTSTPNFSIQLLIIIIIIKIIIIKCFLFGWGLTNMCAAVSSFVMCATNQT